MAELFRSHRGRTHKVGHEDRDHLCRGGAHPPIIRPSGDSRGDVLPATEPAEMGPVDVAASPDHSRLPRLVAAAAKLYHPGV
jgi:hypothetical protein